MKTRVVTHLWDALFPRFCVGCGREGSILCTTCHEGWAPDGGPGEVWFLAHYADPIARGLLTTWKYHFDETAWHTLARRLHPSLTLMHLRAAMADIEAIVPVPLSRERRAERGFDQAEIIAQWIALGIHRPVVHLLERKFTTGHQAERSTAERKRAMADSPFRMLPLLSKEGLGVVGADAQISPPPTPPPRGGESLALPRRILLVDDVWTTGATMQAAARTLTAAGIAHVQPMTVLKG